MSLSIYLTVALVLDHTFSEHVITGVGWPYESCKLPMVDLSGCSFRPLNIEN